MCVCVCAPVKAVAMKAPVKAVAMQADEGMSGSLSAPLRAQADKSSSGSRAPHLYLKRDVCVYMFICKYFTFGVSVLEVAA